MVSWTNEELTKFLDTVDTFLIKKEKAQLELGEIMTEETNFCEMVEQLKLLKIVTKYEDEKRRTHPLLYSSAQQRMFEMNVHSK